MNSFDSHCKWKKGYPNSENQWVNKVDVFAEKALWEFKCLNPTLEVHIRQSLVQDVPHSPLTTKYMSSPTPSTIEDILPLSYNTSLTVGIIQC